MLILTDSSAQILGQWNYIKISCGSIVFYVYLRKLSQNLGHFSSTSAVLEK